MNVQKCLFLVVVLAAGIATTSQNLLAATFQTQAEAAAACADGAANQNWYGGPWACYLEPSRYVCRNDPFTNYCGSMFYVFTESCADSGDKNGSGTTGGIPQLVCSDGCEYVAGGGIDAGQWWVSSYSATGNLCGGSEPAINTPEGCTLVGETVVCDCVSNPEAPFCTGNESNDYSCETVDGITTCDSNAVAPPPPDGGGPGAGDPNDSGGSDGGADGGTSGGNAGTGDGDPDTPDGNGTGDGDTDEDGERDVDCNPLSNPDCAFAGSGSASSVCGEAPSCSGDPVNCAILIQNYNIMCAILTTAENEKKEEEAQTAQASNDCDTPPQCDGDPVQCTAVRQSWENACMITDVGSELAPWQSGGDEDYGRDLSEEAGELDVTTGTDQSGFATGACPADIPISAMGVNMSISMAYLCSYASIVRVFVILITLIWSATYIVRSF